MNKLKLIVPVFMAAVIALAIPFTAACKKKNKEEQPVTTELQSISLDTSLATTQFYTGENFDSIDLVVTATLKKSNEAESYTEDVSAYAVVDSSAYNRNEVGVYAINVSYTFEEQTKSASYDVTVSGASLTLDTSNLTLLYLTGETLNRDGLKVYANILNPGSATPSTTDVTRSASVDWSAVNMSREGDYTVTVTARVGTTTKSATFTISVREPRDGLDVQLAENVQQVINLSEANPDASIDPTAIVVKRADEFGNIVSDVLSASDYTINVYNENQEEVTSYTNLKGGVYQIWVTLNENTSLKGFALIYVVDELVSLTKTATGDTEQFMGVDIISGGWTFLATYVSGNTEQLTVKDVVLDGFNTNDVGANKKATATYTYVNAKGDVTSKSVEITYTVKELSGATVTNTYDFSKLPVKDADYALQQSDFTGVNAFITLVEGGTANWRAPTNSVLEIRNDALQVTFRGTGTLTLQARSTGNTNKSTIGVKDSTGNKIAGTFTSENVTPGIGDSENIYMVTGAYNEIVFNITEPGTYTIYTVNSIAIASGTESTGRNTRIGALVTVDNIPDESGSEVAEPIVINVTELINDNTLAVGDITAEKVLSSNVSIMAGANVEGDAQHVSIDANGKKATIDGKELSFTHRLKLNGITNASTHNRSLKLKLSGACTIEVYAMSGSSSDANRKLNMVNSAGTEVGTDSVSPVATSGNTLEVRTITVTAEQVAASEDGIFYLGCTAAINLYYVRVVYSAS